MPHPSIRLCLARILDGLQIKKGICVYFAITAYSGCKSTPACQVAVFCQTLNGAFVVAHDAEGGPLASALTLVRTLSCPALQNPSQLS